MTKTRATTTTTHADAAADAALGRLLRVGPDAAAPAVEDLQTALAARAEREGLLDIGFTTVASPVGDLTVAATDAGLLAVGWDTDALLERLAGEVSPRILPALGRLDPVRRQLDEYFAGQRRQFEVAIDWTLVSGFRRSVLAELRTVPYGAVVTYGELAERVDNPKASRAVGTAMAHNPMPIVVPCHRVLRAGGQLGNYSGAGGAVTKRWLLDHEQVT